MYHYVCRQYLNRKKDIFLKNFVVQNINNRGGLTTAGRTTVGFAAGTYNPVHFFPISTRSYIYIIIRTIGENKNKNRALLQYVFIRFFFSFQIVIVMKFQDSFQDITYLVRHNKNNYYFNILRYNQYIVTYTIFCQFV